MSNLLYLNFIVEITLMGYNNRIEGSETCESGIIRGQISIRA